MESFGRLKGEELPRNYFVLSMHPNSNDARNDEYKRSKLDNVVAAVFQNKRMIL
jgi:hypothetical protein